MPGFIFQQPYTLTLTYADADLAACQIDEANLNLHSFDGGQWIGMLPCVRCALDKANNRLIVRADHFTHFALAGLSPDVPTHRACSCRWLRGEADGRGKSQSNR